MVQVDFQEESTLVDWLGGGCKGLGSVHDRAGNASGAVSGAVVCEMGGREGY